MPNVLKPLAVAGALAGSVVGSYKAFEAWYEQERLDRLQSGAEAESSLPYYEETLRLADAHGLSLLAAGGLVKQALIDENTEYDTANRLIIVSDDPKTHARQKATLYRGRPELTLRDSDWRIRLMKIHHEYEDIWVPPKPKHVTQIRARQKTMQKGLDAFAASRGFKRGPELSLFPYEDDFDQGGFRVTNYASRTMLIKHDDTSRELLFDNNGNHVEISLDDPWTCVVNHDGREIRIPTNSPTTLLGRTLTRAVANRQRDVSEVRKAIEVLNAKDLGIIDEETWAIYLQFRTALDTSLGSESAVKAIKHKQAMAVLNLGLANMLLPAKNWIEDSAIGMAIRDPELEVFSNFFAKLMGAKG